MLHAVLLLSCFTKRVTLMTHLQCVRKVSKKTFNGVSLGGYTGLNPHNLIKQIYNRLNYFLKQRSCVGNGCLQGGADGSGGFEIAVKLLTLKILD